MLASNIATRQLTIVDDLRTQLSTVSQERDQARQDTMDVNRWCAFVMGSLDTTSVSYSQIGSDQEKY